MLISLYLFQICVRLTWAGIAFLIGLLLTASIFFFGSRLQCNVVYKNRPEYTSTAHEVQKSKDYAKWVKNLPDEISCGIDCLFYIMVPEDPKDKELDFIPDSRTSSKIDEKQCSDIPLSMRFDCDPGDSPSQSSCEKRGCCWEEVKEVRG